MDNDEIIINIDRKETSNTSKNKSKKSKNTTKTKKPLKKAVNKTASKNIKSLDKKKKNKIRTIDPVKQKKNKKILNILIILVLIIISLMFLLSSSVFNIREIITQNNEKLSDEQIISLSKIEKGTNIFSVSNTKSIDNIKENAYIDTVRIKRILPNKVQITVKERTTKYMLQYADSYVYVDKQGYMLEISNEKLDVPILIGIATELTDIEVGNRISNEDLSKMNAVNNIIEVANSNDVGNLITKVDISDEKNYTLILETESKTAYLGDCSQLNTRMLYLKSILEAETGKSGEIFINVDLNNENVYFREATNI